MSADFASGIDSDLSSPQPIRDSITKNLMIPDVLRQIWWGMNIAGCLITL